MKLASPSFENGQKIHPKFTCEGENVNPKLIISDVPKNAKSLCLVVDDPDSPSGTWTHWLVWNIPPDTKEISENSVPGTEGANTFGEIGYGGPCPGVGEHRYFFKLFALDTTLDKIEKIENPWRDISSKRQQHRQVCKNPQ
jgi:Raf kinase inhibitor-like YbhB/YbcL family protein